MTKRQKKYEYAYPARKSAVIPPKRSGKKESRPEPRQARSAVAITIGKFYRLPTWKPGIMAEAKRIRVKNGRLEVFLQNSYAVEEFRFSGWVPASHVFNA